jgi:hypothetical protein
MTRLLSILLPLAIITLLVPGQVLGAGPEASFRTVAITANDGAIAARVSPIPVLITDDTQTDGHIRVDNISSMDEDVRIRVADYSINANGTPVAAPADFLFGSASWYQFETADFTLAPGMSRDIPFTLNIPFGAGAGDHFASLNVYVEAQQGHTAGPSDGASAHSILLIQSRLQHRITGAAPQTPSVELSATAAWDSVAFDARVVNAGNTVVGHQADPTPTLLLYNLMPWADASRPERTIQVGGFYVAPESVRDVAIPWTDLPLFGQYRAVFTLPAADGQPEVAAEMTLTVINMPMVIGLVLVLAVALAVVGWLLLRRQSRRRASAT